MAAPIRAHEDSVLFREAVNFTAAQTRFLPRLIEKDYFCTLRPMVTALSVPCLSWEEAMAEKLRAALSRREVAIRDFYDIDYAVRRLNLDLQTPVLLTLVRGKLAVPGNEPVDVSGSRLAALRQQLASQLKPFLRTQDFEAFDLEAAFQRVMGVVTLLDGQ